MPLAKINGIASVLEMMKKRNENNMINDDWNTEDIGEEKKCDNDL